MDEQLVSFLNERAVYLEKERIKGVRLNYLYRIVKLLKPLLKGLFIVLLVLNVILPFLLLATIGVGILFLLCLAVNNPREVFEDKLKRDVLPTIFKSVNETFGYHAYGYNGKTLQDSGFLNKGFFSDTIKIEGEDYVKGQVENIDVEFFEIKFYKEVINYGKTAGGCLLSLLLVPVAIFKSIFDNDGQSDEIPVGVIKDVNVFFSGFFMFADFHKEFDGKVLMIPKKNERIRDRLNEILKANTLREIEVENPYINENYNIYASDIQTGYYVLSQHLIDRIHTLSEKEKALPIISFINGKMYFVIPWHKNFFNVDLSAKINDGSYFLPYISEIGHFEKMVKDLNLNTRIWSKR